MAGDPKYRNTFPDDQGPYLPPKANIRILMLTDDDGSYTPTHKFGLTELVETLESTPGVFTKIKVTKAHRDTASDMFDEPAGADIQGFRFDDPAQFNPADFDEIWLIGIREWLAGTQYALSQAELRIVAEFMDQGGGVFATGDHQDLGGSLSREIPRVRSMRHWSYDYGLDYEEHDPSSDQGPPVYGSFRHDTLVAGHDSAFTFDDQSDDIPAKIKPKMYGFGNSYFQHRWPHPILCGPQGIIYVLPDHMHEGECVIPKDLTKTFTFDGYTTTEYPSGINGQVIPDVIATGEVFTHVTDNTDTGGIVDVESKPAKFGVCGAYDGHEVDIGRVVVDSTFHHFVNINVIASGANSPDPVKQAGLEYSATGQEAYDDIRAYWRNIAIWLARPQTQMAMFTRVIWAARWDSQLRMVTPTVMHREMTWKDTVLYGGSVRATLFRLATPCLISIWTYAYFDPLSKFKWWLLLTLPDPPPWEGRLALIDPEEYALALYGGVMTALVRATPRREQGFRDELDRRMPEVIRAGVQQASKMAAEVYSERIDHTQKMVAEIRAAGRKAGK